MEIATKSQVHSINHNQSQSSCITPDNFSDRGEKLDFDRLINNESLGSFVRNNIQSRQFQTFLN